MAARGRKNYGSQQGPRKGRIGAGREFLVNPSKCTIKPGELVGADRRFTYVPYRCLPKGMQQRASRQFPHKTPGIPDSAYAYPFSNRELIHIANQSASIANARRALLWGLARVKRKTRRS